MTIKTLNCGKTFVKAHNHNDTDLKGTWDVFIKIDGVRVIRNYRNEVVSREGKPLHNCDHLDFQDAEFFRKDWNTSVSCVRTTSYVPTSQEDIYELTDGCVDERLFLGSKQNPTNAWLQRMMQKYVDLGHEGIVIRKGDKWVKVVPLKMADVRIISMKPGAGKNLGLCGSIGTAHGSVGSFARQKDNQGADITDLEFREYLWKNRTALIGKVIQVGYRETTAKGKLRFPTFIRFRWDKTEESLT